MPLIPPKAQIKIYLFQVEGHWSHWIQVEGSLSQLFALRLAIYALVDRLLRGIW